MATSEPLVPTGLPYGERQQIEGAMQTAGLPSSVPPPGASPSSPTPSAGGGGSLQGFDVFADREPSGVLPAEPTPDARTGFKMRVAASPNPSMRYYFSLVEGYLED